MARLRPLRPFDMQQPPIGHQRAQASGRDGILAVGILLAGILLLIGLGGLLAGRPHPAGCFAIGQALPLGCQEGR